MSATVLKKIEALVNRVILLDPHTLDQLPGLAGKRILVDVIDLELSVLIYIENEKISLTQATAQTGDVTISGRVTSLSGLVVKRDSVTNVFPKDVEIKGDVHLAQEFQNILKGLEIDWEEYASHWIGDTAARKLGNMLRANRKWMLKARDNIKTDISEYLRFEIEMLPDRLMIDEFNNAVDAVRDDTERLQQRIRRLQKHIRQDSQ